MSFRVSLGYSGSRFEYISFAAATGKHRGARHASMTRYTHRRNQSYRGDVDRQGCRTVLRRWRYDSISLIDLHLPIGFAALGDASFSCFRSTTLWEVFELSVSPRTNGG